VRIDLKEVHKAIESYGVLRFGPGIIDLLFFQYRIPVFSQRISIDDIGQCDLLALLAEALNGDGRLAAPMKHAKADAHIFGHEQGFDRNVYETDSEAAGPGSSGGSGGRRAILRLFRLFLDELHNLGHEK